MNSKNKHGTENQGEGNKTADKEYREAATKYAHTHDTGREGKKAEREISKNPQEFSDAEKKGKSKSAGEDPSFKARSDDEE